MSVTNRELLKEAIADAKSIKETAIANAKAALEESFTPYLKEKLSAKLAEMEEKEEGEDINENEDSMNEESKEGIEEISLDELLAELKDDEPKTEVDEAKKAETEEEIDIEDMSENDLKKFIEGVIKNMVEDGELEAGPDEEGIDPDKEGDVKSPEEGKNEPEAKGDEDEVNLDELLAEIENGEKKEKEVTENQVYASPEEIEAAVAAIVALIGGSALGTKEIRSAIADAAKRGKDAVKAKVKSLLGIKEGEDKTEELNEAYAAINTLKEDLADINLLNAKLLYTNKIFRNKSLTESQKVKVLSAFDKATSKKEAELVYETLKEGLKTPTQKSPIKESLGSASKPMGNASKQPIVENNAFTRMQELAFGPKNK